jgi:uncharacterized protein YndB with AHSA1/START domain
MDTQPIIAEQLLHAPVSKVWKAITDKAEMKKWYFDLIEFKAIPGFIFHFSGGPSPEKQYVHVCVIKEVLPEKKLSYSWRYEGYEGDSVVTFELFPKGNQTLVKLIHTGVETFPKDNPDFAKKNFVEGWNHFINTSLKDYLIS